MLTQESRAREYESRALQCKFDKSMSKWVSKFTCPGFMCVPKKPWPFGNEYHTICCAISGIMYQVELVEGKDERLERCTKEYEDCRKIVGLLMRLIKPIWGSGRTVILDSGFCVLKELIELRKKGVFASMLIKKGGTGQSIFSVMTSRNTSRISPLGQQTHGLVK